MNIKKLGLIGIIGVAIFFLYQSGYTKYLSLDYIKENLDSFKDYYAQNMVETILIFALIYIGATVLFPGGATVLTLTAGALFGVIQGVIIVSFASTIGATVAFLLSRSVFRDTIQNKYGDKLKAINDGIEKDGASYLLTLRLQPVFPFFLVNVLMGLTPIKTSIYYLVSQIGMLPGTAVYVNAGSELGKINSLKDIMSPTLIGSFLLFACFLAALNSSSSSSSDTFISESNSLIFPEAIVKESSCC